MRTIVRTSLALPLLTLLALVPLAAREPRQAASDLPAARTLIDGYIEAMGGREAVLAQTSVRATGTFSIPASGLSGTVEFLRAKPNKFLQKQSLPGIGEIEEGFDGTVGWTISPLTGPALLEGKQLEQTKFYADFFEDLKQSDRYTSMTTVEKTTFEGRPVYKVKLVAKSGDEDFEFYDVETKLKVGEISTRDSPMGSLQATTSYSDYRKFGSLLHPVTTKMSAMSVQMVVTISTVEYGKVDPSAFAVPPQIKALIK
jgi:hypothetical protein